MADNRELFQLVSTGTNKEGKPTGYFYVTEKNKRNSTEKLELIKFDPRAWNEATQRYGKHVAFKEKKLPRSSK